MEHLDTATIYNNIALSYTAQGKYDEALNLHQKAMVILEKVMETEHLYVAMTYSNIAKIYTLQRKNSEALEWYFNALTIYLKKIRRRTPAYSCNICEYRGCICVYGRYCGSIEVV